MVSNFLYKIILFTFGNKINYFLNSTFYNTIFVKSEKTINPLLIFFKQHTALRQSMLSELTVYDEPFRIKRFTLVCFLLSVEYNNRFCIKTSLKHSSFESLVPVFTNSNWSEREIRDMFGIFFTNNSDLRRLLTDYGFEGFPLRKDFPLTGYVEVRYDDELQRVLYEPVELSQEFRLFALKSPWEK